VWPHCEIRVQLRAGHPPLYEDFVIATPRLILRPWREADVPEFARVTNTPAVMEYLGGVKEPEAFQGGFLRAQASQEQNGFSFWIIERRNDGALLGFCGLKVCNVGPIVGDIEIGWRLREDAWGQGYAGEAAQASLDWAWQNLSCDRIVAITAEGNARSWRLMERLGMQRENGLEFDHPDIAPDSPLRRHITYAVKRPAPG
jgi:RimJ/RimL family protein N-acetyltransferase